MIGEIIDEVTKKGYDGAKDLETQIKNLLKKVPPGGFLHPEDEKEFWRIINNLQKEREKILKR